MLFENPNASQGPTFNAIGTSGTVAMIAGHFINGDYHEVQDGTERTQVEEKRRQDEEKSVEEQKSLYFLHSRDGRRSLLTP